MRSLSPWQKKILSKRTLIIGLLVAVMVALFIIRADRQISLEQVYEVVARDVEQAVQLTGEVAAVNQVNLAFDTSGTIAQRFVEQGETVAAGDLLLELDYAAQSAELAQANGSLAAAQSNVALAQASLERSQAALDLIRAQNRGADTTRLSAAERLENTKAQQAILVANAYAELLNNDIAAYLTSDSRALESPIVSGSYQGDQAGTYSIEFYRSGAGTGVSARYTGMETGTITFDNFGVPGPLGSRGLFVTLPASGQSGTYANTTWEVVVPNIRSASYQSRLSAYTSAKQTQTAALQSAQANFDLLEAQEQSGQQIVSVSTAQEAQAAAAVGEARAVLAQRTAAVAQAAAAVAGVQSRIEDARIRAPFAGVIARLNATVGETVSVGTSLVTLITEEQYEVRVSVPEIDVAKVKVGDAAKVRLDIYGADAEWDGLVTNIELVETQVSGVPVYESLIVILNPDERMRVGMNARARILLAAERDVTAVPASYVIQQDNTAQVLVRQGDRLVEDRMVELGILGTDSFYYVRSGLTVGDILVKPTK